MFNFTKLFWHNSKPQTGKLLGANLINLVIILLLFSIALLPIQLIMNMWLMYMFTGQGNMVSIVLATLGSVLLILLVYLFVVFPLYTGSTRSYRNTLLSNKSMTLKDFFASFKGRIWRKAVLIALFTILILFITQLINYFLSSGISKIAELIIQNASISSADQSTMMVVQTIITVITGLVTSIFTWLAVIYITNAATSLVHDPDSKVKVHLKNAWLSMRNKNKTFLKFFISIIVLNFIIILLYGPIYTWIQLGLSGISQNVASIVTVVLNIVFFIIRYLIFFVIIGTIVQYFLNHGEKEQHLHQIK
ncbi:lytic transglycosylase [Staphylococcus felis]|uniref:lytic transglycosylase n=1 Tax=Staphylococcus felis TaxID=46127 RepID=UPI000E26702B|nr:lytic transglycosylase [Staphylococcus felis]REH74667.1 lytic transglycosylase [Staphylococcus felis]REI13557.1 lytic transglycosylase [Staphylococcus felis]REI24604.1 lytic transglycosylase [Staphylococcus felis]REI34263.1 lytic transglycosylase [Staphylococcus felis]